MSYCRFSSDNWKSDVYVYESDMGFEIHVASNRFVGIIPAVPLVGTVTSDVWIYANENQHTAVSNAEMEDIGGKFDGQRFTLETAEETILKLNEIIAAGYHVPDCVIPALANEVNNDKV